jgi:hypothetical protein
MIAERIGDAAYMREIEAAPSNEDVFAILDRELPLIFDAHTFVEQDGALHLLWRLIVLTAPDWTAPAAIFEWPARRMARDESATLQGLVQLAVQHAASLNLRSPTVAKAFARECLAMYAAMRRADMKTVPAALVIGAPADASAGRRRAEWAEVAEWLYRVRVLGQTAYSVASDVVVSQPGRFIDDGPPSEQVKRAESAIRKQLVRAERLLLLASDKHTH